MLANVKAQMVKHRMTNADMAALLRISENTFSFKLNERREFTLSELAEMALRFGVTIDYLIEIRKATSVEVRTPPDKKGA